MSFEKKSAGTEFSPVNEILKAVPVLGYEIRKRIKSSRKETSSEKIGTILKLGLECLFGVRNKLISIFFLLAFTDVPMMLSGIFFVGFFFFLKENVLHFYSYNTE